MALSQEQIAERIANPIHKDALEKAQKDNDWCQFHARVSTSVSDAGSYFSVFKSKVEKVLTDPNKRSAFWDLLPLPLPTTRLISEATEEWNKAFYANDKYVEYELKNSDVEAEFGLYLEQTLKINDTMDELFNLAIESPNAVVVFDLPREQTTPLPKPYYYVLQPKDIIDVGVNGKGVIEWLIFNTDTKDEVGVIDELSYRIFKKTDTGVVEIENVPNTATQTPASFVWADTLGHGGSVRRYGLLIPELSRLDKIVRGEVFEENADLFAAHPIMQKPEEVCLVEGCKGGYFTRHNDITGESEAVPCGCDRRKSIGPGSTIEVPENALLQGGVGQVVQFIQTPTDSLQYYTEKVQKLRDECFLSLTGGHYNQVTQEAVNEKQVKQDTEKKRNKLTYIGENLERLHKFILDVTGSMRHGNAYQKSIVKYGSEFYLETIDDAIDRFSKLSNVNAPKYLVNQQLQAVEQLYAQSNQEYAKRLAILKLIEPYRNLPLAQLDPASVEYQVKARFGELIDTFEMYNGSIVAFGSETDFSVKIETIKSKIYEYATGTNAVRQEGDSMPSDAR